MPLFQRSEVGKLGCKHPVLLWGTPLPSKGWARVHLNSAFSSEELCSWHCSCQTSFTAWGGLGSVPMFCPRASCSNSSTASGKLLTLQGPCSPAFSWGGDHPSLKHQSHLQRDEAPAALPRGVTKLPCASSSACAAPGKGESGATLKERPFCNPSTGWCGQKSRPWGLLSSSHLSTRDTSKASKTLWRKRFWS